MKVLVKQSCLFGDISLKGSKQKPGVQTAPGSLVFDAYFVSLVKEEKIKILSFDENDSKECEEKFPSKVPDEIILKQIQALHAQENAVANSASVAKLQEEIKNLTEENEKLALDYEGALNEVEKIKTEVADLLKQIEEHVAEKQDLAAKLEKISTAKKR